MITKLRSHLNFANVVALLALFVALSGTSYAVSKVSSKDIRKNAVRGKHIKRSQIRSGDIRNRTIRPIDIAPTVTGQTLQSSAGQVSREAGPTGVAASGDFTPVVTMSGLQPGAYVLLAKTNQSGNTLTDGRCRLAAEGAFDDSNRGLRATGTSEAHNLQLVHSFAGAGTVLLACRAPKGVWSTADSKIIAIRVGSSSSNSVSG